MARCYMYVVDRDFGFAPNPFHGHCTLATCKPGLRARAQVDDWVIGMGGARLKATGRCIFAMRVSEVMSFDEFWSDPKYLDKRPVRNGSLRMMVGDNIYHREKIGRGGWMQADSHHSYPDGTPNPHNVVHDTQVDRILASNRFIYFGQAAPTVPQQILSAIAYQNVRNYRVFTSAESYAPLLDWLKMNYGRLFGEIVADPFDFAESARRYSTLDNSISS